MTLPQPAYEVKLVEKDGKHFYQVNNSDDLLPGTTGILGGVLQKKALVPWASKLAATAAAESAKADFSAYLQNGKLDVPLEKAAERWVRAGTGAPNKARDKAGDTGTAIHADLEAFFTKMELPKRDRTEHEVKSLQNVLDWYGESGFTLLGSEVAVAVPKGSTVCGAYGGKMDLVLQDRQGRVVIADFKTGKGIYTDAMIQMAAYKVALEETYPGVFVDRLIALHVRPDVLPGQVAYECPAVQDAVDCWLMVRKLHDKLEGLMPEKVEA